MDRSTCSWSPKSPTTLVTSYDYGQFFSGKHGGKRTTRRIHTGAGGRLHLYAAQLPGACRSSVASTPASCCFRISFATSSRRRKFPTTSSDGVAAPPPAVPTNPLVTTREIQRALTELGYDPGPVDGVPGSKTRAAIKRFQADHGLIADGIVGPKTRAKMQERLSA